MTYGDLDRLFTDLPRPLAVTTAPPYRPYPQPGRYPVGPRARSARCAAPGCRCCCTPSRSASGAIFYFFLIHDEMKRHSGEGLGGVLALVINLFAGVASPFLLSHEVGGLYERAARAGRSARSPGCGSSPASSCWSGR